MNAAEIQEFKLELAGTAEAMGKELTPTALRIFADDLSSFELHDAVEALRDCRRSLARFPTIADIIGKIQASDGRPGVEAAWAMIPKSEDDSAVWTAEMAGAYGIAAPLLASDEIAARMAFKEKYIELVKQAREARTPVKWSFTGGFDRSVRSGAISRALGAGLIPFEVAMALGYDEATPSLALPSPIPVPPPELVRSKIQAMIAQISKPLPEAENEA